MLFAAWLTLGIAYLLQAVRHAPGRASHLHRWPRMPRIRLWGLASVAAMQVVFADPARPSVTCRVASPQEAAIVADKLFEREESNRRAPATRSQGTWCPLI